MRLSTYVNGIVVWLAGGAGAAAMRAANRNIR
jgi:hypothetical protein